MENKSLFVVIEGLDGSGKTSISRELANVLDHADKGNIKLTFEPHDPSCAGLFIRQILMKKHRDFTPNLLALAFAANRLDHCDREIDIWLKKGKGSVLICDRYYLSSLVYQSSPTCSFEKVMLYNEFAIRPDIIFFINVDNKVCYERMKIRNQPKELFETNLTSTRQKYAQAIQYLRETHQENIIEIDGNGTLMEVVGKIKEEIYKYAPHLKPFQAVIEDKLLVPHVFTLNGKINYTSKDFLNSLNSFIHFKNLDSDSNAESEEKLVNFYTEIDYKLNSLDFDSLGSLFLDYTREIGYTLGEKLPWTHLDCYELSYQMPANITQRGIALLINQTQRYDVIMQMMPELNEMSDFILAFSPGPSEVVTKYYERSKIQYKNKNNEVAVSISPTTQLITVGDIAENIKKIGKKSVYNSKMKTIQNV